MTAEKANPKEIETFDRSFWISVSIFILIILAICSFPYVFTRHWNKVGIYFHDTGQIGDTIGGIMGPFIAIAASLLTFFAFWVQYKANIQQRQLFEIQTREQKEQFTTQVNLQREQFENQIQFQREQFEQQIRSERDQLEKELAEQRSQTQAQEKTWRIQQFENKYYELLRIHRANVEEINIAGKVTGRKTFVTMFYELKCCYHSLEKAYSRQEYQQHSSERFSKKELLNIAYKVFFYGCGQNSDMIIEDFFKDDHAKDLIPWFLNELRELQKEFNDSKKDLFIKDIPTDHGNFRWRIKYFPFDGHATKLGHYYRHLFQTVQFVAESDLFSHQEKYEYLKSLRAQLSNHEQLLLYYNTLSDFGRKWNAKKYLTDYKLLKNIPIPSADFGQKPEERFLNEIAEWRAKGQELFGWDER